MKKVIIVLNALLFAVLNTVCQTDIPEGNVSGTWTFSGSPYRIQGNITIPANDFLIIEAGVEVVFQGYYVMNINGTLRASGQPGDTIRFTITDTTGFSDFTTSAGSWQGIMFQNDQGNRQDTTIINFCKFSFMNNVERAVSFRGGLRIAGSHKVRIQNTVFENNYSLTWAGTVFIENLDHKAFLEINSCLFRYNVSGSEGGALVIWGDDAFIRNSQFLMNGGSDRNSEGGGAIYLLSSTAVVENNLFQGNDASKFGGTGGGILIDGGSPTIIQNRIFENQSLYGAGIHVVATDNAIISKNHIALNEALIYGGGIYMENSDALIVNNLVNNNLAHQGGGVYLEDSDPRILNNTFAFNRATQYGGGIYSTQGNAIIENMILSNNSADLNGDQVYIFDNFSSPDIIHSLFEGGLAGIGFGGGSSYQGNYQNNIEVSPQFISVPSGTGIQGDALGADFDIQIISPCINAGNPGTLKDLLPMEDLNGEDRIIHGETDIGAYEAHIQSILAGGSISGDVTWIADTVHVTADIIVQDNATLNIAPGTIVLFGGHYKLDIRGVLLARGTPEDSIWFTINDTTGFYQDNTNGSWKGIYFNNSSTGANGAMSDNAPSFIENCAISYAKTIGNGGGLYIHYFSNLVISGSRFSNNGALNYSRGGAIFLDNSDILIDNCLFSHNFSIRTGGGALYANESDFQCTNSKFLNNFNEPYGQGGAMLVYESDIIIKGCDFIGNNSGSSYGGAITFHQTSGTLTGSRFSNNIGQVGGAVCTFTSGIDIVNCLFVNNYSLYFAGAINYYTPVDNELINCTFANNLCGGGSGALSYLYDGDALIYNCIFTNNQGSISDQIRHDQEDIQNIQIRSTIITGGLSQNLLNLGNIDYDETLIDTIPGFVASSAGVGNEYDGLEGDWSINAFSAAINGGTMVLDSNQMVQFDLNGSERVKEEIIDIGAFENQDNPIEIIKHPVAGSRCIGEVFSVWVETSDTANISWLKDGEIIPGANGEKMVIDSLEKSDQGNYMCLASNGYGEVFSNQVYLNIHSPPVITSSPSDIWTKSGANTSFTVDAWGSDPLAFGWYHNDSLIEENGSRNLAFESIGHKNEGRYKCVVTNICGSTLSDQFDVYISPQICMVTVSATTGHNLVVWEKKSIAPVMAYNIYRESVAAGIYDRLATMPYDELSVFVDTTADPTVQAYLYKITAIDTSVTETDIDLCKPHKTIHLIVSTNPELNTTQLQWDRYYGFDYQTYTIYKSATGVNFDPVHSLSASLNSWTDPQASTGDLFYRIAVEKPDPCVPDGSGKKAGTGPYVHSLSNLDDNKLKAGQLPPDSVTINNNTIPEESSPGTMIGKLFTEDADTNDSHTYQFVSGEGDDDNASFTLLGDLLLASESFDYETKNQYSVRIRSTDKAGGYCEVPFLIEILDVNEATGIQIHASEAIVAYPNPFIQSTTIRFPNPGGQPYEMRLTDLSGKTVRMLEIRAGQFTLKRKNLRKGMYLIEIKGDKTFRGKLMIE